MRHPLSAMIGQSAACLSEALMLQHWTTCSIAVAAILVVASGPSVVSAQTIEVDGHVGAACSGAEFSCRDFGAPTLGTGLRVHLGGPWSVGGRFDHISAKDRRIPSLVMMSRSRQFVGAEGAADVGGMDRPHLRLAAGIGLMRESVDLQCEEPGCGADASRTEWNEAVVVGADVLVPVRPAWSILAGWRAFMGPPGTSVAIYGGALLRLGSR